MPRGGKLSPLHLKASVKRSLLMADALDLAQQHSKAIATLGVKIAMLKNDLEDTQEGMAEDQAFLRDIEKKYLDQARDLAHAPDPSPPSFF